MKINHGEKKGFLYCEKLKSCVHDFVLNLPFHGQGGMCKKKLPNNLEPWEIYHKKCYQLIK